MKLRKHATARTLGKFALLASLVAPPAGAETLEEVIVTATRRPVALSTYPGSATRIDATATALVGATHASELVNRAARGLDDPNGVIGVFVLDDTVNAD